MDLDTVGVLARFWGGEGNAGNPAAACTADDLDALRRFDRLVSVLGIEATLFVTGRSLDARPFAELVGNMSARGHEIANHTWDHPDDLTALSARAMAEQIDSCSAAIERVTGIAPCGFRAPCYRADEVVLTLLEQRGYAYDASVLPSPVVPLMKGYRGLLGPGHGRAPGPGVVRQMAAPRSLYRPSRSDLSREDDRRAFVEVPVTVATVGRVPLTSTVLGILPFGIARALVKRRARTGVPMTFVLHLVDLVDGRLLPTHVARLHPAAVRPLEVKLRWCREMLDVLLSHCRMTTTRRLVAETDPGPTAG
ncbi:MAG: polysaccharide deacetylase family protein [Deltaproteobacteria bacterium]|nr:polysaccharide deacetylase family protein [Deltaproteobacteria bacterium]